MRFPYQKLSELTNLQAMHIEQSNPLSFALTFITRRRESVRLQTIVLVSEMGDESLHKNLHVYSYF
ncbi:hypothetical protein VCRA2126O85_360031 [Vibrio crassostreae]|nr:hypothetical protein VCRA2126O86_150087 [Vibrio crassostreae]CAK2888662.1 hypothetical protein VCRA2128O106_350029 [Vibrio crassostreae]CAK2890795.1 hypothetical protein VCRA2128O100_370031 [Vibrio crassostreae]CAK2891502.1 hypothetical protein VCRA2125O83_350028 [Vibrio crassostreae]CAK2896245.1 hypothetical protein VCRA2126O85_360031 [Vibrio crassostreae]